MNRFVKKVEFEMRNGDVMELDVTSSLLQSIKESFGLNDLCEVDDEHIKSYLVASIKKTLEMTNEEE